MQFKDTVCNKADSTPAASPCEAGFKARVAVILPASFPAVAVVGIVRGKDYIIAIVDAS
jgi:hypothetical protein